MKTRKFATRRDVIAGALGATLTALGPMPRPTPAGAQGGNPDCFAIEHATVLSMVPGSAPRPNMTVLIEGDRIAAFAPATESEIPGNCSVVDGSGQWLMPGLTDMHAHFLSEPIPELDFKPEEILAAYFANGVLQIVDMAATSETNAIRDAVAAGEIVAPFVASAAMIDSSPAFRPGAREIARPEEARGVVAEIAAAGFDFVKVYSALDLEAFAAVLTAAEELDIRVIGHLPGRREHPPAELIQPGFAMIAHAEELSWLAPEKSDAEIDEFAALMVENGVALTSTLFLNEQIAAQTRKPAIVAETEGLKVLHPIELMMWFEENPYIDKRSPERIATLEAIAEFNQRLVKAFVEAGIPVFAGTDASFIPGLAPGFSLHEEVASLVGAGLSPLQALEAATIAPARWLGVHDDRGTVEVGKRANLILLHADPLADIRHSRAKSGVIFNGQYFDRQDLDERLVNLEARYAPYRPLFSPVGASALEREQRSANTE